ncbi:hypothetical protein F7725_012352 [Dissostichus mawsoni]|uniref:Uncharacterized protein n=1 Tax=Dissostichus mawsoni TaxID=36200 RepID=A0A7J5YMI8_DISMA|nr:hypothetical protein F7725_012352 [Dissostichus mawsoni]
MTEIKTTDQVLLALQFSLQHMTHFLASPSNCSTCFRSPSFSSVTAASWLRDLHLGLQLIPLLLNGGQMGVHVVHLLLHPQHLLLQPRLLQLRLLLLPLNAQQLLLQLLHLRQQTLFGRLQLADQLFFGAGVPTPPEHPLPDAQPLVQLALFGPGGLQRHLQDDLLVLEELDVVVLGAAVRLQLGQLGLKLQEASLQLVDGLLFGLQVFLSAGQLAHQIQMFFLELLQLHPYSRLLGHGELLLVPLSELLEGVYLCLGGLHAALQGAALQLHLLELALETPHLLTQLMDCKEEKSCLTTSVDMQMVVAERRQAGVLALQTSLELHHGPLQLGGVLPQCADLCSEGALLLLAELRLRLLRLQLSVHRSQLSLKLRLLLESLEQKTASLIFSFNTCSISSWPITELSRETLQQI